MNRYLVIMQDEWNNLYFLGIFDNLNEAIPSINDWLEIYDVSIDSLEEYPSTLGMCFDKEIETKDENVVMVRGFILDDREILV